METNKYHNSKIYKIISNHTDKIYIGSTTQKFLVSRKAQHKGQSKTFENNGTHYISSYELIVLGDVDIILIENFKCENKEELHARERYHIELNKELCVNMCVPSRTKKEWNEDNKEHVKEHYKKYREKNNEKIQQYQKEYREKNQDKKKENNKEYREKNKDKIKEKQNKKSNCECGGKYTNSSKSTHLKSKKHLNFINTNQ